MKRKAEQEVKKNAGPKAKPKPRAGKTKPMQVATAEGPAPRERVPVKIWAEPHVATLTQETVQGPLYFGKLVNPPQDPSKEVLGMVLYGMEILAEKPVEPADHEEEEEEEDPKGKKKSRTAAAAVTYEQVRLPIRYDIGPDPAVLPFEAKGFNGQGKLRATLRLAENDARKQNYDLLNALALRVTEHILSDEAFIKVFPYKKELFTSRNLMASFVHPFKKYEHDVQTNIAFPGRHNEDTGFMDYTTQIFDRRDDAKERYKQTHEAEMCEPQQIARGDRIGGTVEVNKIWFNINPESKQYGRWSFTQNGAYMKLYSPDKQELARRAKAARPPPCYIEGSDDEDQDTYLQMYRYQEVQID